MKKRNYSTRLSWTIFPLCLLLLLLGGCDSSSTTASNTPTATPQTKGPGSAALTATARATVTTPSCSAVSLPQPAQSAGTIYTDAQYPIKMFVPAGWNAKSFNDSSADSTEKYYEIWMIPNTLGTITAPEQGSIASEAIRFTIRLSGPSVDYTQINFTPESRNVTINHIPTTLYQRLAAPPDCAESDFATKAVKLGGNNCDFYFQVNKPAKQTEVALFLQVLQSFQYAETK